MKVFEVLVGLAIIAGAVGSSLFFGMHPLAAVFIGTFGAVIVGHGFEINPNDW